MDLVLCVYVGRHTWYMCGAKDNLWVLGIDVRSSILVAGIVTH